MSAADFTGSWFATGFFGHNRGRWRNDFLNHYRQLARPKPPEAFLKRLHDYRTKNVNPFSEHDTKQSREFINVSFEQPIPPSVRASKTARFVNRDVIAWTRGSDEASANSNCKTFADAYQDAEKTRMKSSYSETYNAAQPKLISSRPVSAYDYRPWTSTYRHAFCNNQPVLDAMGSAILTQAAPVRTTLARSASTNDLSAQGGTSKQQPAESVSSCMVWCDATPRVALSREQTRCNTLVKNPDPEN